MLRIGTMNMMLHGIESPDLTGDDSLSQDAGAVRDCYTLILANPPFKGSLNFNDAAADILRMVGYKPTAKPRAATVTKDGKKKPPGGTTHQKIRAELVDGHKLDAVIDVPSGVFKPYAGASPASSMARG